MSKKIVALRPRSPKRPKVVAMARTRTPAQRAETMLRLETEVATWRLRGLKYLLDAWVAYEHDQIIPSETRDKGLGVLGLAADALADTLEDALEAVREAEAHSARPRVTA